MTRKTLGCVFALLMLVSASSVYAGGPLILFDAGVPYAYPVGTVDVYTDLGNNGSGAITFRATGRCIT